MLYDITRKDLSVNFPVYTKAGHIWKNRIDWEVIQVAGNKVKTYFGIFTFLRAYKVDKVWYWVLTDGTKTITVKRDQARRNKNLPKTASVQTTLMLTEPKELIDQLIEQVERLVQQYNEPFINNPANYTSKGKLKNRIANILYPKFNEFNCNDTFLNTKIRYINYVLKFLHIDNFINTQQCKDIYKQLKIAYHPDRTHTDTIQQFQLVQHCFNWI